MPLEHVASTLYMEQEAVDAVASDVSISAGGLISPPGDFEVFYMMSGKGTFCMVDSG